MQPAIELADGFPLYAFLRNYLISERKATEQYQWSAKTYYPNGRIPEVGEMFRQPNLARTMRAIVAAEKAAFAKIAQPRGGDPGRPRRVLQRRYRPADRGRQQGRRRRIHLRRPRLVPRPGRKAVHDELSRLRHLQGRTVGPGTGPAADAEYSRGRRSQVCRRQFRRIHPSGARGDQARLRRSQRVLRRSRVHDRADDRSALEALRRGATRAHWRAGFARTPSGRSVQVRPRREASGTALRAALRKA